MPTFKTLTAICALSLLTGCGSLFGGGPMQGFELRGGAPVQAARQTSRHVTVEIPETAGSLSNDRILIRPSGLEASYLPGTQWTDEAPLMVQTLLLRALQDSGGYAYVGRKPLGLSGDYAILSELTDLQAEITPGEGAVLARVGLMVQIVRESDARVLASRKFTHAAAATGDSAAEVTLALDTGIRTVLPQITGWILAQTGAGVAR